MEAASADVVILGGGPAGCATAIALAERGRRALIIERGADGRHKVGETLPPNANPYLDALGLVLNPAVHHRSYGTRSAWAGAQIDTRDFMHNPYGHGWHLDRTAFERQLADRAADAGAGCWSRTGLPSVERTDSGWEVAVEDGRRARAPIVVDATGRGAWFARSLGARRVRQDGAAAVVAFLETESEGDPEVSALIEAAPLGWWYSAGVPGRRLATAFVTSPSVLDTSLRDPAMWKRAVAAVPHTSNRLQQFGYVLAGPIIVTSATGGLLEPMIGDGWLAVGDAAVALDPLSSHGITSALAGGLAACEAIIAETPEGFARYEHQLGTMFDAYQRMRRGLYLGEQRWPDSPYWSEVHQAVRPRKFVEGLD